MRRLRPPRLLSSAEAAPAALGARRAEVASFAGSKQQTLNEAPSFRADLRAVRAVEGLPAFRPHGEGHAARSRLPGASYPQPSAAGRVRAPRGRRFSALAAWPVFPFTSEPPTAFRLPPAWPVCGRLPGSVPRGRSRPGNSARDSMSSRDVAASWTSREARRPWRPRPGAERGRFPELFAPLTDSGLRGAGGDPPERPPARVKRGSHTGRYFQERAEFPSNPCAEDAAAPGSVTRGPQEPLRAADSTRLGGAQRGARAGGEMGAPEVSNHSVALTGPGGRCAARRPAFRAGEGQTERIRTGEGVSDRRCPSLPLLSHSSPASSSQPAALGWAGGRKTTENKHKPNSLCRPAVSR